MENYLCALSAAFGLIVGSFLNVVVARLPHHKSVVRPRSQCPSCGALIRWYDNIPLFSFLLLRGRCRHCRTAISPRYPVIEFLTALLFFAACRRFGFGPLLFLHDWPFVAILIAVTFIDLEHRIIPDPLSLGGLAIGLATSVFVPDLGWLSSFSGAALGFGLFYAMAWLYLKLRGHSGLGGGDIKLLAMIGAFVGPKGVLVTIVISSVFGSLAGVIYALAARQKKLTRVAIPYGPFLVFGGLYYYLIGDLWFQAMTPM